MAGQDLDPLPSVVVVCLCAQWCGVCRDYVASFAQVQAQFPQARFLWVDIEDEADLLHPLDVEDFPTLLIAVAQVLRFYGPLTPQPETLTRLIRAKAGEAGEPAVANPQITALVARILAKHVG
jgi:thiol-disulfide isomerase/thioredoxin